MGRGLKYFGVIFLIVAFSNVNGFVNVFNWIFIRFMISLPSELVLPCPTSVTLSTASFSSFISLALFFRLSLKFFYFTLRFMFVLYLFFIIVVGIKLFCFLFLSNFKNAK